MGKSRGRSTTKIHISDAEPRNPIDFKITEGEIHGAKGADKTTKKIGVTRNFVAAKVTILTQSVTRAGRLE